MSGHTHAVLVTVRIPLKGLLNSNQRKENLTKRLEKRMSSKSWAFGLWLWAAPDLPPLTAQDLKSRLFLEPHLFSGLAAEQVQTSLTPQMLFIRLSIQKENTPVLSPFSSFFFSASKWQEGIFLLSSLFPSFPPIMHGLESGSPKEACCRLICSDIIWDFAVSCGFWASWQRAPSVWCHPSAHKIFCAASLPAARQKTNPLSPHKHTHTHKSLCFCLCGDFHRQKGVTQARA